MDVLVVRGTADQRIAAVAAAQRCRISREQLLALGVTDRMSRTRRTSGLLRPEHRGVFAVGPAAEVELGPETGALLACGRGAVLAGRTALYLSGMVRQPPHEVQVAMLDARSARSRPGIRVNHTRTLTTFDVTTHHGLPLTTPARALLDFADECSRRELELAFDEGLFLRRVSRTKVSDVLRRLGAGRSGAPALRALVELGGPSSVTRSEAEEGLRHLLVRAGVPAPHVNDPVHGYVADFHWRQARYVVEVDGHAAHSTLRTFQRDRAKDRVLAAHGIHVDRFTWHDVTEDALRTVAHVAATVARRMAGDREAA